MKVRHIPSTYFLFGKRPIFLHLVRRGMLFNNMTPFYNPSIMRGEVIFFFLGFPSLPKACQAIMRPIL